MINILKDGEIKEDDTWLVICLYQDLCKICTAVSYQKLWKAGDRNKLILNAIDDLQHGPMPC